MTVASVTAARRRLHRQHEKSPSTAAPTRRTAICPSSSPAPAAAPLKQDRNYYVLTIRSVRFTLR